MQGRDEDIRDRIPSEEEENRSVREMAAEYDAAFSEPEEETPGPDESPETDRYDDIWKEELSREDRIPQLEREEQASLWSSLKDRIGKAPRRQTSGEQSSVSGSPAADSVPAAGGSRPVKEETAAAEAEAYAPDEEDWEGQAPQAGVEYHASASETKTERPAGSGNRFDADFDAEQDEEERRRAWIRRGSAEERASSGTAAPAEEDEEDIAGGSEEEPPQEFNRPAEEPAEGGRLRGFRALSGRIHKTVGSAFGRGLQEEEADLPEEEDEEDIEEEPRESKGRLGIDGEEIPMPDIGARLLDVMLVAWGFISEFFRTATVLGFGHIRNELRPSNLVNVFSRYLLGIIVFFYEILLKFTTTRGPMGFSIFYILLYSIAWGLFGFLLTSFLRPKANRFIRKVLILLLAIPYITEYFIYRQFKIFWSPAEVWFAMRTSLSGNIGTIFRLMFNSNGLVHIIFFLVPFLLYVAFVQYWDKARRVKAGRRLHTLAVICLLFFVTWLLVLVNGEYRRNYSTEYTFHNAVTHFGLLTADRLEVRNDLFGGKLKFEQEPAAEVTSNTTTASDLTEEITRNALDINFGALAESASGIEKELDLYLTTQTASAENDFTGLFKGKNLIVISAESFHGDLIDKNLTPTLYRLANSGITFADYYVPATSGSVGGEYALLFGMYPMDGASSLPETSAHHNVLTIGSMLTRMGYWGKAYTNLNYTQDGRDLSHMNLGYSEGFAGYGSGLESGITEQSPRSDLELFQATVPEYIEQAPFNVYYMTNSGKGSYTKSGNAMSLKNWGAVEQLQGVSDTLLSYIAANLELENAMAYLVSELERTNQARNTVIVLTSNTYPYQLDANAHLGNMPRLSELYGYSVETALQRDHNTLIMWSGALESQNPVLVKTPVSVIDILPTLANLFDAEWDSRLFPGRDIFSDAEPLIFDMDYNWRTDKGSYIASAGEFTPTDTMEVVTKDYQKRIRTIVRNKMRMMRGMLDDDYMAHVFAGYTWAEDLVKGGQKRDIKSGTTAESLPAAEAAGGGETAAAGESAAATDAAGNPVSAEAATDAAGNPVSTEAATDAAGNPVTTEAATDAAGNPVTTEAATDADGNPVAAPEGADTGNGTTAESGASRARDWTPYLDVTGE